MKLSEAMILGSMIRPQVRGHIRTEGTEGWGTCALGAAFEVGKVPVTERCLTVDVMGFRGVIKAGTVVRSHILPNTWRKLLDKIVSCPVCGEAGKLERVITLLNDQHLWSRQGIALWVQQFEPKPRKRAIENEHNSVAKAAGK